MLFVISLVFIFLTRLRFPSKRSIAEVLITFDTVLKFCVFCFCFNLLILFHRYMSRSLFDFIIDLKNIQAINK